MSFNRIRSIPTRNFNRILRFPFSSFNIQIPSSHFCHFHSLDSSTPPLPTPSFHTLNTSLSFTEPQQKLIQALQLIVKEFSLKRNVKVWFCGGIVRNLLLDAIPKPAFTSNSDSLLSRNDYLLEKIPNAASDSRFGIQRNPDVDVVVYGLRPVELLRALLRHLEDTNQLDEFPKPCTYYIETLKRKTVSAKRERASAHVFGMKVEMQQLHEGPRKKFRLSFENELLGPSWRGAATAMLLEDAHQRDFSVNAAHFDVVSEELEDSTGFAIRDAKARVLKTVLPPLETFVTRPDRVLRAFRLMLQCDLHPDPELLKAIKDPMVLDALRVETHTSVVGTELTAIFASLDGYASRYWQALLQHALVNSVFPRIPDSITNSSAEEPEKESLESLFSVFNDQSVGVRSVSFMWTLDYVLAQNGIHEIAQQCRSAADQPKQDQIRNVTDIMHTLRWSAILREFQTLEPDQNAGIREDYVNELSKLFVRMLVKKTVFQNSIKLMKMSAFFTDHSILAKIYHDPTNIPTISDEERIKVQLSMAAFSTEVRSYPWRPFVAYSSVEFVMKSKPELVPERWNQLSFNKELGEFGKKCLEIHNSVIRFLESIQIDQVLEMKSVFSGSDIARVLERKSGEWTMEIRDRLYKEQLEKSEFFTEEECTKWVLENMSTFEIPQENEKVPKGRRRTRLQE